MEDGAGATTPPPATAAAFFETAGRSVENARSVEAASLASQSEQSERPSDLVHAVLGDGEASDPERDFLIYMHCKEKLVCWKPDFQMLADICSNIVMLDSKVLEQFCPSVRMDTALARIVASQS